jgi:hypothetical protein
VRDGRIHADNQRPVAVAIRRHDGIERSMFRYGFIGQRLNRGELRPTDILRIE